MAETAPSRSRRDCQRDVDVLPDTVGRLRVLHTALRIIPFALLIWALHKGAPPHLKRTGAIAGVVAGASGATAYAFHCPDDSLPFVALCAWSGGRLRQRFQR
jgi:hypothetical protein